MRLKLQATPHPNSSKPSNNHRKDYDEPQDMKDALIAAGVDAYNSFKIRCREVMLDLFVFHTHPKVPG